MESERLCRRLDAIRSDPQRDTLHDLRATNEKPADVFSSLP